MVYYRTAAGLPFKFPAYPAQAVAVAPLAWFEGKYVLIGVDLPQTDRQLTPFALSQGLEIGLLPGVAIHAHSLASIVSGDTITILPAGLDYGPALAVGLFCLWIAWRPMSVSMKPLLIAGALLLLWTGEALAFARYATLFPIVAPTVLALGLSAYVGFLAWKRDTKARHFIQSAFSRYVSPAVVEAIVKEPARLSLGGERRMIVAVFTDVEDFTSLSERLAPELLARILNEYLDGLCELFVEHGATIDKIIGDAVVGFFGAPATQDEPARRAVALALAVEDRAQRLRERLLAEGHLFGATRIGVHGGPAIVGNFGGDRFFNYTAIGDTINTAARLEGANKFIGTRNCISSEVARRTSGFLLRPAGVLYLKGKHEGIEAFEVLRETPANVTLIDEYSKAYELLAAKDDNANAAFDALAASYPDDRVVAFHRHRLASGCLGVEIHFAEK
ncbi:MAG: adenylate/guanylate cyclase domain-containing protein [Mesorhizobium sp.]|nr:MAG: adenylate/guanylate cyclase domain-containing protein [Mesorhizobium sp.]